MTSKLDALRKAADNGKDRLLDKMAKIPPGYTHIGIANTEVGITAVVASEMNAPLVYDPLAEKWVSLMTKTEGGLITK